MSSEVRDLNIKHKLFISDPSGSVYKESCDRWRTLTGIVCLHQMVVILSINFSDIIERKSKYH